MAENPDMPSPYSVFPEHTIPKQSIQPQPQNSRTSLRQDTYHNGYDQPEDAFGGQSLAPQTYVQVGPVPYAVACNRPETDLLYVAIVVCICGAPFPGILAIIFAALGFWEYKNGRHENARQYNKFAQFFIFLSTLISIMVITFLVVTLIILPYFLKVDVFEAIRYLIRKYL